MLDPRYGSDDNSGYDEPTLPYIPYNEPYTTSSSTPPFTHSSVTPTLPYEPTAEAHPFFPVAELGAPITEAVPTLPQKRSRRGLWIALASILVLLIVGTAGSFAYVSYLNRSTPNKTLDFFCNALQKQDYKAAYSQFTSQLQKQFSETDFAGILSSDKVVLCSHGTVGDAGDRATTNLTLKHDSQGINNDKVMLTKDADNVWKINDLQKAS